MPYIKRRRRKELDEYLKNVIIRMNDAGELNYAISVLCNGYLMVRTIDYKILNEIIGVLECAKLEIYRRLLAPYEDKKIEENGDVFI